MTAGAANWLGTADAVEVTSLAKAGVTDLRDLASLKEADIERITGQPCSTALLLLRADGLIMVEADRNAPLEGSIRGLFPTTVPKPPPPTVQAQGRAIKAPRLVGGPEAQWHSTPAGPPANEQDEARRAKAANIVVGILRDCVDDSTFSEEIRSHVGAYQVLAWYDRYVKVLAKRYEAQGIMHACRTWWRWLRWRAVQVPALQDHPATPSAVNLATWLEDEAARGHTVQRSLHGGLKWLQQHLGLEGLPLKSPLVRDIGGAMGKLVETRAKELPIKVWIHFVQLADIAPGAIGLLAKLVLYIIVTCMRFRHAQRHRFLPDMCSPEQLVGRVSRGKTRRRAAYLVAGPIGVEPGRPMFLDLQAELLARMPQADFLVPDLATTLGAGLNGDTPVVPRAMKYDKFMTLLRALTRAPPLSFTHDEARQISTYSLRRKLPTLADRLNLSMQHRAELGDWSDPVAAGEERRPLPAEPMAVRYSAARLGSSVRTREVCLAVLHLLTRNCEDDEKARDYAAKANTWRTEGMPPEWAPHGPGQQTLVKEKGKPIEDASSSSAADGPRRGGKMEPRAVFPPGGAGAVDDEEDQPLPDLLEDHGKAPPLHDDGDTSSSSSSSNSAPDSDPDDEAQDEDERSVIWILTPDAKASIHRASGLIAEDGRPLPVCRRKPFNWGFQTGVGLGEARKTRRPFHAACWKDCGYKV